MDGFKFLLKRGSTICTTVNGSTVLMEAVNRNRLDFVDYLVSNASKLGLDLQVRDKRGSNVLFYAASVGNPDIFRRLVEAGCSVDTDNCNRTVYMQAALNGHLDMVKYLTANAESLGLKLEQTDNEGRNVLFYGVESGCLILLKYLLSTGIKCRPDKKGKTNLMQAARAGNLQLVDHFLANAQSTGLDIHSVDSKGENALFYAVRSRRASVVSALVERRLSLSCTASAANALNVVSVSIGLGLDDVVAIILDGAPDPGSAVCSRDAKGRTALHHFVEQGDLDMLMRYGSNYRPEADADLTGCTLLMCASKLSSDARQMALVRYLVEVLGVEVSRVDARHRSALFYAVESGSVAVTAYLLQRTDRVESDSSGLSLLMVAAVTGNHAAAAEIARSKFIQDLLGTVDRNGRNEVHYCAMHDCVAILDTLVPLRCGVDVRDSSGKTPLMYAAENGRYATVACLVRRAAARVDLKDDEGRNVLHHCFMGTNSSLNCTRVLIQKGADINLKDRAGITPLMLACQTCAKAHIPLIRFLIEQGADPIIQDNDGSDAFDYCPFDSEYVKAILRERTEVNALEREALWSFQEKLSEGLHLNSVLRGLIKEGIFTKTLSFEVMKQPHVDRMRKMIEILCTRGESAFRSFCLVLKKEGEIETSYELRKMAYRKELEIFW